MKAACILLLLLPLWGAGQTFLLIDRNLHNPVRLHDELTLEDFATGTFPVYAQDVQALVHTLDTLARRIDKGFDIPRSIEANISEHCSVLLWHDTDAALPTYTSILRVNSGHISAPLSITKRSGRRQTVRKLKQLSDYLRNNRVEAGF